MMFRSFIAGMVVIGFAIAAFVPNSLLSQEVLSESEWKRGFHGFNLVCDAVGLSPLSEFEFNRIPPKESVLVILGDWNRYRSIDRFLGRGGAVLAASDQFGASPARLPYGIRCRFNFSKTMRESDAFAKMADCPLITDLGDHPVFDGVTAIATNRPGELTAGRSSTVASFPALQSSRVSNPFVASVENKAGGRLLAVADQSVFANQMITYEDNDLFAYQSMKWLKGENRKYVMVVVNGQVIAPTDPSDVELRIQPPSREEVIDALKSLPPSAMLDFANSVATVVEDQDMVNEFIHDNMDQVSQVKMNRFLIFLSFGLICLCCVVAFVWQKKLLRQTASVVATQRKNREAKHRKSQEQYERQWAAGILLDSICIELADRRYNDWPGFPIGLEMGDDASSKFIFQSMTKASNHFKSKPRGYWNRKRLQELEQDVLSWRKFFHERDSKAENDPEFDTFAAAVIESD